MERLDFCSVMGFMRSYISEDRCVSQIDFLYMLFDDYFQNGDTDNFVLDNGLVCRWINGQAKVSPKITGYYISDKKGRNDFADNFEENILPLFYDTGFVITRMQDLLVQDNSISEMQRQKLNSAYPCNTEKAQAEYITNLLLFGMERNFVKRETRTKRTPSRGKPFSDGG